MQYLLFELWLILFTTSKLDYRPNMVKSISHKMRNFLFMNFYVHLLVFEIWLILYSTFIVNWSGTYRDFCEPDSDANRFFINLIQKGAALVGGETLHQTFFYCLVNGRFCSKNWTIFQWILSIKFTITKKIKIGNWFFIRFSLLYIFPVNVTSILQFFLLCDTLEYPGVSPVNCKYP